MQTMKQLSIFIENKMGELTQVTKLLSQNNLSIKSINLAEASDFGLLRVIVDDEKKARANILPGEYQKRYLIVQAFRSR